MSDIQELLAAAHAFQSVFLFAAPNGLRLAFVRMFWSGWESLRALPLPGQLFFNTQIPVCLWFLTNDKTAHGRDRRGETLFIDAREMGAMETRVLRVLTEDDIAKIADTVQAWKTGEDYQDVAGFCKSASLEDIEKKGFVLTPGRYVGSAIALEDIGQIKERLGGVVKHYLELAELSQEQDQTIEQVLETLEVG
jgi:type I restriction enzyme M protein